MTRDGRPPGAVAVDARGNLLWSDSGTVAAVGVNDLIVVRTGDAVLVVPLDRAQEVRRLIERITLLEGLEEQLHRNGW